MACENAMLMTLALLVIGGLIAFALYSSITGEDTIVAGSGNAFDAYYGKDRWDPGQSLPCDECVSLGCIGAGECRCYCHRAHPRKKKK
jgi:hypothetical protein